MVLSTSCPKCSGNMIQGFIVDFTQGGQIVSHWSSGAPQSSFWMGTQVKEENMVPVGSFRCDDCGYLESYARAEFAPTDGS